LQGQILFLFSQDFTVNLDSLARVVEGFLDRVAGAKAPGRSGTTTPNAVFFVPASIAIVNFILNLPA